jgi:hypothetical protein
VNTEQLRWYIARARCMTPSEVVARASEQARRRAWRSQQVRSDAPLPPPPRRYSPTFPTRLPPTAALAVPAPASVALLAAANRVLDGTWETLGVERHDLVAPDWFFDPVTRRHAPRDRYAFSIQHRSEAETGNVKQVWELSRHHQLTLLAAAYFVSGDDRYAERVAEHLTSWWKANPFLSGIHWTSGIEVGLRLIAWTWIRRLLDAWPAVGELFEHNDDAARQLYWHQRYLDGFRSRGSSANNHVIAEAAGQLVAGCAFPWFDESRRWRASAARVFSDELARNTFPSGVNRELASEYHGFVTELAFVAAIEAEAAGVVLGEETWTRVCRMTDTAAALIDATGRPPRQGDGDDAFALRVDGDNAGAGAWSPLLALGATVFGPRPWWPAAAPSVFSTLVGSLANNHCVHGRPRTRPNHFADAGIVLMRTSAATQSAVPEIWCRCDAGPHGFLKTAAHAHADALSIEVRHSGVDVLADPGTYCYHGEPEWRAYFRSTAAHNTVEIARRNQSQSGGPFLWTRSAGTHLVAAEYAPDGEIIGWWGQHDGYTTLSPPALHQRTVRLDPRARVLTIIDRVESSGKHELALNFQLGPAVDVELDASTARLRWCGRVRSGATLRLPADLRWTVHRGERDPVRGWYSPSFGVKVPSTTLTGVGTCASRPTELVTVLDFDD